ncbi:MAG: sulfurtransferase TusA family protein [Gammaproteobacteria bacterium]|nr:sulfurtransferase TusA family protein [Gammaproteobacteria bacterium]
MSEHELDARRMLCPMPVIKVQDAIKDLHSGDILNVVCSDPGAIYDVPAWSRVHGHQVLLAEVRDEEVHIQIKVEAS